MAPATATEPVTQGSTQRRHPRRVGEVRQTSVRHWLIAEIKGVATS